jgi:hypothetical protein
MKTEEDEAFDELARRQGMWGGGFPAKRQMAADKLQDGKCKYCVDGCIACDARAQPVQEPVAWEQFYPDIGKNQLAYLPPSPFDISGKPQQRPWVGLTDEEIDAIYWQHENHCGEYKVSIWPYERAIEAKLKEKNFD